MCSGCPGAAIGLPLRANRTGGHPVRTSRPAVWRTQRVLGQTGGAEKPARPQTDRQFGETGASTDRLAVQRNRRAHGQTGSSEKPARPQTDWRCRETGAPTDRPAVRRNRRAHGSDANDSPPRHIRLPRWKCAAPFGHPAHLARTCSRDHNARRLGRTVPIAPQRACPRDLPPRGRPSAARARFPPLPSPRRMPRANCLPPPLSGRFSRGFLAPPYQRTTRRRRAPRERRGRWVCASSSGWSM